LKAWGIAIRKAENAKIQTCRKDHHGDDENMASFHKAFHLVPYPLVASFPCAYPKSEYTHMYQHNNVYNNARIHAHTHTLHWLSSSGSSNNILTLSAGYQSPY